MLFQLCAPLVCMHLHCTSTDPKSGHFWLSIWLDLSQSNQHEVCPDHGVENCGGSVVKNKQETKWTCAAAGTQMIWWGNQACKIDSHYCHSWIYLYSQSMFSILSRSWIFSRLVNLTERLYIFGPIQRILALQNFNNSFILYFAILKKWCTVNVNKEGLLIKLDNTIRKFDYALRFWRIKCIGIKQYFINILTTDV